MVTLGPNVKKMICVVSTKNKLLGVPVVSAGR